MRHDTKANSAKVASIAPLLCCMAAAAAPLTNTGQPPASSQKIVEVIVTPSSPAVSLDGLLLGITFTGDEELTIGRSGSGVDPRIQQMIDAKAGRQNGSSIAIIPAPATGAATTPAASTSTPETTSVTQGSPSGSQAPAATSIQPTTGRDVELPGLNIAASKAEKATTNAPYGVAGSSSRAGLRLFSSTGSTGSPYTSAVGTGIEVEMPLPNQFSVSASAISGFPTSTTAALEMRRYFGEGHSGLNFGTIAGLANMKHPYLQASAGFLSPFGPLLIGAEARAGYSFTAPAGSQPMNLGFSVRIGRR